MGTQQLPKQLPHQLEQIAELPGHEDRVWNVAWNPVKRILASCSADKSVRLYTYPPTLPPPNEGSGRATFNSLNTIQTGHTRTVRSLGWSPSGTSLATASFDGGIGIWEQEAPEDEMDVDEGTLRERIRSDDWECMSTLEGHESECKSVSYSPSGNLLATCGRDKTVWIWEGYPDSDFAVQSVLMEHSQDVKCVAWHPAEEILASASYDDTIKLYYDDPDDEWYCFQTLSGHGSTVWSIAWSPTKSYLASSSDDKTVRVWKRVEQFKWDCVLVLGGHTRSVYSVTWGPGHPNEKERNLGWIASCDGDGNIFVWEIEEPADGGPTSPPRHKLIAQKESTHGDSDVNSISWNTKPGYEDMLATGGDDCMLRVWRVL